MIVGPAEADRHLEGCLKAARSWADMLIVYGDDPDAKTRNLIGSYAHIARIGDQNLYETGEHLVRNRLLELADDALDVGDIIVSLDADEELHAPAERIRDTLSALEADERESWNVHFLHLWTPDGSMHRVDGLWQPSIGPRVYRHRKGYRLEPLYESAWVCPGLPPHLLRTGGQPAILDVLHWSYARPADRPPKHERYSRLPGHNLAHIDSILETPVLEPVLEPVPCR
jgi:hypothetical protein